MEPKIISTSCPVGHLPLIRSIIDTLGIPQVIERYCPRHELAHVSDAECVSVMLLNILSGRVATYLCSGPTASFWAHTRGFPWFKRGNYPSRRAQTGYTKTCWST